MGAINYFESRLAAERYALARPDIHSTALSTFVEFAGMEFPIDKALDVGCGTGQSSVALAKFARHVVGIDSSESMLAACLPHPQVDYLRSEAESLPASDGEFGLITVAQAFHWLDQATFLAEAHRALRAAGWLVIYNGWFTAHMREDAAFVHWFRESFLTRFPAPARRVTHIVDEDMRKRGFSVRGEEVFSCEICMTVQQFTDYELSTTNIIAATGDDPMLFDEAQRWIADSIRPFFAGENERTFLFSGRIWYLQKEAA